jgi:alcohol dehydrogenase
VSCVSACGRCRFVTHHFALDDITAAYDTFSRAADTGAIKVVMTRS